MFLVEAPLGSFTAHINTCEQCDMTGRSRDPAAIVAGTFADVRKKIIVAMLDDSNAPRITVDHDKGKTKGDTNA